MGIASFLSKKAPPPEDISSFKSQAYGATVESLPPVLGTNPIPGNGVNAIGSNGIHQLPRKKSRPQLPVSHSTTSLRAGSASPAISISSAAPAPLVPRLRSSTVGRPNTAPDNHVGSGSLAQSRPRTPGKTSRSRRNSIRLSVAFLKRSGSNGDLQRPGSQGSGYGDLAPPVPPIPLAHSPAPDGSGRFPKFDAPKSDAASLSLSTSMSMSTSENLTRGQGFVDLLDAQGEIRPSNFRSRVQAAGVRDYGEDVAERNIAINGVDVNSPAVAPFYATSNIPSKTSTFSSDLDSLAQRPRTMAFPKRVDSFDVPPRHENKSSHSRSQGHEQHDSNGSAGFFYDDTTNRWSQIGLPPVPAQTTSGKKTRPRPLQLEPIISNSSESGAEPPIVPRQRLAVNGNHAKRFEDHPPPSPRRARDSLLIAKSPRTSGTRSPGPPHPKSGSPLPHPHVRDFGGFDSHHHHSAHSSYDKSVQSEPYGSIGGLAVESAADMNYVSAAPAPKIPSFFRSDYSEVHMSRIDSVGSSSPHRAKRGGRVRSFSRPTSASSPPGHAYPRTRSLGGISLPGRPILGDITEHIPPRVSSRRNWSISSSTPPASTSDYSSDRFMRPHSGHTAETSIPPTGSIKSLSLGSRKSTTPRADTAAETEASAYFTAEDAVSNATLVPRRPAIPEVDTSTPSNPRQPGRKNWSPHDIEFGVNTSDSSDYSSDQGQSRFKEDGLLFREDGYGHNTGAGLPGLFSGRESPTPSEWSIQTMTYDQALDLIAPGGLRPPNTPSVPKGTFTAMTLPSFETSSNDGGSDATSESGMDARLDAKMAMKVRREIKRRGRMATMEKRHGKQPVYTSGGVDTPTSHPQQV